MLIFIRDTRSEFIPSHPEGMEVRRKRSLRCFLCPVLSSARLTTLVVLSASWLPDNVACLLALRVLKFLIEITVGAQTSRLQLRVPSVSPATRYISVGNAVSVKTTKQMEKNRQKKMQKHAVASESSAVPIRLYANRMNDVESCNRLFE